MKKVLIFAVLATLAFSSLAAQTSAAEAQRLVGTWVSEEFTRWDLTGESGAETFTFTIVFNANGTGNISHGGRGGHELFGITIRPDESINFTFGVSLAGIINMIPGPTNQPIFLSPNGSRMILNNVVFQRR